MMAKEKADVKLNCFYAAVAVARRETSRKGKPTTEEVLAEAEKISQWVLGKKGDDK